jgi:uncharacterized damage-inducible protein DinB
MNRLNVYADLVEDVRRQGEATIRAIEAGKAWSYRVQPGEHSVRDTFNHAVQALFEDAGNWCLHDATHFSPSQDPTADLADALSRVQRALQGLQEADLDGAFVLPWGQKATLGGALRQTLLHAVGHFAQLRNWVGIKQRARTQGAGGKNR